MEKKEIKNIEELKREIEKRLDKSKFDGHFYFRKKMRPYISEGFILSKLRDFDDYFSCNACFGC